MQDYFGLFADQKAFSVKEVSDVKFVLLSHEFLFIGL